MLNHVIFKLNTKTLARKKYKRNKTNLSSGDKLLKEEDVRTVLEGLFIHVAAMPWADTGFNRNAVMQQAAGDQIIGHSLTQIMKLAETPTESAFKKLKEEINDETTETTNS